MSNVAQQWQSVRGKVEGLKDRGVERVTGMRRIRRGKGYEAFAWGPLIAGMAFVAGCLWGCHLHFHAFEKHYHEQGTKGLRDEGTQAEPWIEPNPRSEPGIEIVIPSSPPDGDVAQPPPAGRDGTRPRAGVPQGD